MRINVVGGRVAACMHRMSTDGDFRSNLTRGGTMEAWTPTQEQAELAIRATELLGLPRRVVPAVMLTLGWPKVTRKQPPKYPTSILVHENQYQELPDDVIYSAYRKQNNYQKMPPKPEKVDACCAMAERLHGAEYAAKVRADIEQKGYISPYQYWFGCWYTDEPEFLDWAGYRSYFKHQGFNWLEEKEKTT